MTSQQGHRPEQHTVQETKQRLFTQQRREHWNAVAQEPERRFSSHYAAHLQRIYSFLVPQGQRVLELGCGKGDLLAALAPSEGVGVDIAPAMLDKAAAQHPELTFVEGDAHAPPVEGVFDCIILSDLLNDIWDAQQIFNAIGPLCKPSTRVIINSYSRLWQPVLTASRAAGLARPLLQQNWFTVQDTKNLLRLEGFEAIKDFDELLLPTQTPLLDPLANRYLVKLPLFKWFALTHFIIARKQMQPWPTREAKVTVVAPARNEAGNIEHVFERMPAMGAGVELIFVEGGSSDDTYATIERAIAAHPDVDAKLIKQPGKGKGDAVRAAFKQATGDVLMILDVDLTVPPENLPRFYEAIRSGAGEFINGVRLVYPMESQAMRFFNLAGNKFFSMALSWLLGQHVRDTLCGTKVLSRESYETIAANRAFFGEFDPFGDFDLLFGAAKLNMKIVDVPVRYADRMYGETNIQRWSSGVMLLRMTAFAARKIKFF